MNGEATEHSRAMLFDEVRDPIRDVYVGFQACALNPNSFELFIDSSPVPGSAGCMKAPLRTMKGIMVPVHPYTLNKPEDGIALPQKVAQDLFDLMVEAGFKSDKVPK